MSKLFQLRKTIKFAFFVLNQCRSNDKVWKMFEDRKVTREEFIEVIAVLTEATALFVVEELGEDVIAEIVGE